MKIETTFGELKIGQAFYSKAVRYAKRALACAEDARNWGHVFLAETVVETEEGDGANPEILREESWNQKCGSGGRAEKTGSSGQRMAERPGEFSISSM